MSESTLDLSALDKSPRLLLRTVLRPTLGDRFQPTGFPDLGAATYSAPDGTAKLLVESAQSTANRLEATVWDRTQEKLVPELDGLPWVRVKVLGEKGAEVIQKTSSIEEAHRLNSPYIREGRVEGQDNKPFKDIFQKECNYTATRKIELPRFAKTVFKYDPNSLLHGVFMSEIDGGRLRLARALSGFIEASGVQMVQSGGVKNDALNPSGDSSKGFGMVPFSRVEYTAREIVALGSLDLEQLRALGLAPKQVRLLTTLALYKWQRLFSGNLRLRTACDLQVDSTTVIAPSGFVLPELYALARELEASISACKEFFASPAVTELSFRETKESTKSSAKSRRDTAKTDEESDEESDGEETA